MQQCATNRTDGERYPRWDNANSVRLSARQWAVVLVVLGAFVVVMPRAWSRWESWQHDRAYRIPYALSNDYWLYERHLRESAWDADAIFVVGDSVVWGEYVERTGTVTAWMNQIDPSDTYVNAGVNGMFPLALEGLLRHYSAPLRNRKVILHFNLLWMTSPEQDLSATKERTFNHSNLVPQFVPALPCYRAPLSERLGNVVRRKFAVFGWARHLQACYYGQQSIPEWTLSSENGYDNAMSLPWEPITMHVPAEPEHDGERGPDSERHVAWTDRGLQLQSFDWVEPERSLQWAAFTRCLELLRARGNEVRVVIGPLNEHMLDAPSRRGLTQWEQFAADWLDSQKIPWMRPDVLPSRLYADVSHPLTGGYRQLSHAWLWDSIGRLQTGGVRTH